MGLIFSKENNKNTHKIKKRRRLGELPESCVVNVLKYLDPKDICKFAKLNKAFYGASCADFIWENKLPFNYNQIIDVIFGEDNNLRHGLCKKDLYACLCRVNTIDHGSKKVWLDSETGGMCMAISTKGLSIIGIDDTRYWNHIPTEESRFSSVAYLNQIWWFEINGEVEFPFPKGTYSVFFRVQLGRTHKRFGRRLCYTDQTHGWDIKPVHFQLSTSQDRRTVSQCFLEEPGKWVHYHVGDFAVKNLKAPTRVKVSMTQIDCTHTKGGLCLDSVVVYPSTFKERLMRF